MGVRHGARGFTLAETMVTLVVIGILAGLVVPQFRREMDKTKVITEVTPMVAELSSKLMQHKSEAHSYIVGTTLTNADPAVCPPTVATAGVSAETCLTPGSAWATLRVSPMPTTLRCTYAIHVGDPGDAFNGPLPAGIEFSPPTTQAWFAVLATCDSDGRGAPYAHYFASSVDPKLQSANVGS